MMIITQLLKIKKLFIYKDNNELIKKARTLNNMLIKYFEL